MSEGLKIKDGVLEAYTLREKSVVLPDNIRVIGKGAFKGCVSIEKVNLPETIVSIEKEAFKGCRKLTKINFPKSLESIGEHAFHRCHNLKEAILTDKVTEIGRGAFLLCDNLKSVSLKGVKKLEKQVFVGDINLVQIELAEDLDISNINEIFMGCSRIESIFLSNGTEFKTDNIISLLSDDTDTHPVVKAVVKDIFRMMDIEGATLKKFLININDVEIPEGITSIHKRCFAEKKGLKSVKFPGSLNEIGSFAFSNCISLSEVEFKNEDIIIHKNAFVNCTTLTKITIADKSFEIRKKISENSDTSECEIVEIIHSQIMNNFFVSGTTLLKYRGEEERVIVPDHITVIGERAFSGNEAVGKVILPDSVKKIKREAFSDCVLLQRIENSGNLEFIGESAFENCVKLIEFDLPEAIETIEKSTFNRCRKLKRIGFGKNLKEIKELAFYNCNALQKIDFPLSLIKIGDLAFYRTLSIKEIILPSSLKVLGNNVFTASKVKSATINCNLDSWGTDIFSQCGRLFKITFGEGVKFIGDKFAFNSPSLKYVNIPDTIENIGRNAFEGSIFAEKAGSVINDKIFFNGSELSGDIEIPEGISAIAGSAFYGNTQITSVKLPASLVKIGARAFSCCTNLKDVILPQSVTEIEEGTFAYCKSLNKISARAVIKRIYENAFLECHELAYIPEIDCDYIGDNAFKNCKKLEMPYLNFRKTGSSAFEGTLFLEKLRAKSAVVVHSDILIDGSCAKGKVVIPENVRGISPYAFYGNDKITEIEFPKKLDFIGNNAFCGCRNLVSLYIPQVSDIGKCAFEKCISLSKVKIKADKIQRNAFSFCLNLTEAELSETVSLKEEVFSGCRSLKKVTASDLKNIGDECFAECKSMERFDFGGVKSIGRYAFRGCIKLKEVSFSKNTEICEHAFEDCVKVETISFEDDMNDPGSFAFSGCTFLKKIKVKNEEFLTDSYGFIHKKGISDFVKSIYLSAISCFVIDEDLAIRKYLNNAVSVKIPKGIKALNYDLFRDVMDLKKIEIPESVDYIGERVFNGTPWLEGKKSESPMVVVNDILVDATSSKGDVTIPENIKQVSGWAFENCYSLRSVKFKSRKTRIEKYAFRNCINLKEVIKWDGSKYELTALEVLDDENLPGDVKQIFADCLNCFKTDNGKLIECTGNINDLKLPEGIREIGENVFKESNLLTFLTLTCDVKKISKSAFEHCKWLISVKNAFNIEEIEKSAFLGCSCLDAIDLSDKLKEIGPRAFEHCMSLNEILIPEGITKIPEKTFFRCKGLTKLTLPSTLKKIGKEAFAYCSGLKEITLPENLELIDERAFIWCTDLKVNNRSKAVIKEDSFSEGVL